MMEQGDELGVGGSRQKGLFFEKAFFSAGSWRLIRSYETLDTEAPVKRRDSRFHNNSYGMLCLPSSMSWVPIQIASCEPRPLADADLLVCNSLFIKRCQR
jgi:hypothetical protein